MTGIGGRSGAFVIRSGRSADQEKEKAYHEDEPYGMGRLAATKLFPLSAGFHNVTGLELDGQPIGMHGYFPDPVPYQSLIKLRELRALTSDELSKLHDAAYGFAAAISAVLQFSLLFPYLLKL